MTKRQLPRLVFATNNAHKLRELREIVDGRFEILSLSDIGCDADIPENEPTLDGNAMAKARWIRQRFDCDVFADDTGLEVVALNGEPGVHSARYAGPGHDSIANVAKLLTNMSGVSDRRARFRTVIAAIIGDQTFTVEGIVNGHILSEPKGEAGFGYDPVFAPQGNERSFAQMTDQEKNSISHRGRAVQAFISKLDKLQL